MKYGEEGEDKENEDTSEEALRRCGMLAGKQDANIEELAKERVAAKDNYGNSFESLHDNSSLLFMADKVGIDLGCTIQMIDHNLDIIRKMEQSRHDFYNQQMNKEEASKTDIDINLIDVGDVDIKDLCSDDDHSDSNLEMDYYSHLKNIFASGRKNSSGSPGMSCGKSTVKIGGYKRRKKKKT